MTQRSRSAAAITSAALTTAALTTAALTTGAPTIVVLHAHPDDEAIFTGATIRMLADAGARVVLVTATTGGAGIPRVRLAPGRTLVDQRLRELEQACDVLGVQRLVVLGFADSGAHGGPYEEGTLGAAPSSLAARHVSAVVEQENADAIVHYDGRGIYGHIDHVQVNRIGRSVARRLHLPSYEATVDAAALRAGPRHVLQQAAGQDLDAGTPAGQISFCVSATAAAVSAKRRAMAQHASQIGPEYLEAEPFPVAYGREWFLTGDVGIGHRPVIECLLGQGVDTAA